MTNAFEYGDEMLQQSASATKTPQETPQIGTNQPYLNLATLVLMLMVFVAFIYSNLSGFAWLC